MSGHCDIFCSLPWPRVFPCSPSFNKPQGKGQASISMADVTELDQAPRPVSRIPVSISAFQETWVFSSYWLSLGFFLKQGQRIF